MLKYFVKSSGWSPSEVEVKFAISLKKMVSLRLLVAMPVSNFPEKITFKFFSLKCLQYLNV